MLLPFHFQVVSGCVLCFNVWLQINFSLSCFVSVCNVPEGHLFEALFCADGPIKPAVSTSIGTVDILDSMHYEFDLEIHSLPPNGSWLQVMYIEGGYPSINIDGDSNLMVTFQGSDGGVINNSSFGEKLEIGMSYHVEFQWDPNWLWGSINDEVAVDTMVGGHEVVESQTVYCSGTDPADVSISNLLIFASNEAFRTAEPWTEPTNSPTAFPSVHPSALPTVSASMDPTASPIISYHHHFISVQYAFHWLLPS